MNKPIGKKLTIKLGGSTSHIIEINYLNADALAAIWDEAKFFDGSDSSSTLDQSFYAGRSPSRIWIVPSDCYKFQDVWNYLSEKIEEINLIPSMSYLEKWQTKWLTA